MFTLLLDADQTQLDTLLEVVRVARPDDPVNVSGCGGPDNQRGTWRPHRRRSGFGIHWGAITRRRPPAQRPRGGGSGHARPGWRR